MKLDELERLLAEATPGGWGTHDDVNDHLITAGTDEEGAFIYVNEDARSSDGKLMIAAVNALPALLAVARAADAVVQAWYRRAGVGDPTENATPMERMRLMCDLGLALRALEGKP